MNFQELNINEKTRFLLTILEDMRWFSEKIDNLINSLDGWKISDDDELNRLYNIIIESIRESNKEILDDENEKKKNLVSYLKQKEEEERKKEIESLEIDF